jgi:hypothetical protein
VAELQPGHRAAAVDTDWMILSIQAHNSFFLGHMYGFFYFFVVREKVALLQYTYLFLLRHILVHYIHTQTTSIPNTEYRNLINVTAVVPRTIRSLTL